MIMGTSSLGCFKSPKALTIFRHGNNKIKKIYFKQHKHFISMCCFVIDQRYHQEDVVHPNIQPGRMSNHGSTPFQSEVEYDQMCVDRKKHGYNSGMGEIFRKVAEINAISLPDEGQEL